ncbi:MAG: DegT/DnrJ/EryC1/StrS aminotransferase family protein [Vicinamibacterales bacterium]
MSLSVPFFRPSIGEPEIREVVDVLQSGWLTTGPRVAAFETAFAAAVGAPYAVALNSATAALHLAVEALGLARGQGVLVPTMTFAATAEVVRYMDAVPILVDCDPMTLNIDYDDAERKLAAAQAGRLSGIPGLKVVGVIPVHVGGVMVDLAATRAFAERHGLWVVDDAAHAFPAAWRSNEKGAWVNCGADTARVSCFSFYANKTITTGEGGMAVTHDRVVADRMRVMSLHGLSHDAWGRYQSGGSWDYRIVAPGFKYNLTDIAAAVGIHQLARAEEMRASRESLALEYLYRLSEVDGIELPSVVDHRIHAWHLFPIRLRLDQLTTDRATFIQELAVRGIGSSVHWRPLHLHPYYQEQFKWRAEDCPVASREWERLVSLPLYPAMSNDEQRAVIDAVRDIGSARRW